MGPWGKQARGRPRKDRSTQEELKRESGTDAAEREGSRARITQDHRAHEEPGL